MGLNARDVCVVVCSYTSERWTNLVAAIASLQALDAPPGEIIVVIDHNPALLMQARSSLRSVSVIENAGQPGLSDARNSGVAATQRGVVAFVDDDAMVEAGWLSRLLDHYDDPSVIAVGGSATPVWEQARPSWFPEEFDWVIGCSYRGMPHDAKSVRNLLGCNMSFRREAFDVAGGFDTRIGRVGDRPLGCEETEFCVRLHAKLPHTKLIYEPAAIVRHRVPKARAKLRYFVARCYSEGLSKAFISRTVGRRSALESESRYVRRVLPVALVGSILDTIRFRKLAPGGRGIAVVIGLSLAIAGYVRGTVDGWVREA